MSAVLELKVPLPDFLECEKYGEIRLRGSRILLPHVVKLYREGYSPEQIWEEFTSPSLSLIHKTIAFYLDHRVAIDEYVALREAEITQMIAAAPPPAVSIDELRRRMALIRTTRSEIASK